MGFQWINLPTRNNFRRTTAYHHWANAFPNTVQNFISELIQRLGLRHPIFGYLYSRLWTGSGSRLLLTRIIDAGASAGGRGNITATMNTSRTTLRGGAAVWLVVDVDIEANNRVGSWRVRVPAVVSADVWPIRHAYGSSHRTARSGSWRDFILKVPTPWRRL